jgi:hypothetical protein
MLSLRDSLWDGQNINEALLCVKVNVKTEGGYLLNAAVQDATMQKVTD